MPADMLSYALLQATPIDKDNESEETTMKKSATGSPRRHALLFFLGMMISLVFGIQLGWQLSAHYAVQEQQISRPSQLLPGCMNHSPFHICKPRALAWTDALSQISAKLRPHSRMTGYTPKYQPTNPMLHGKRFSPREADSLDTLSWHPAAPGWLFSINCIVW